MFKERFTKTERQHDESDRRGFAKLVGRAATAPQVESASVIVVGETISESAVERLVGLLQNRSNSSESLSKNGKHEYKDIATRDGLATHTLKDGRKNVLTHLVFVGNSVLGIDSVYGHNGKIEETSLRLLPIGVQKQESIGDVHATATTLMKLNVEEASKPQIIKTGQRVLQPWRQSTVGRSSEWADAKVPDPRVSQAHATIDFTTQGNIDIRDRNSTNGTEIMTLDGLSRRDTSTELVTAGENLRNVLQAQPELWSAHFADKLAVTLHSQK